jgi:hypothetical protein
VDAATTAGFQNAIPDRNQHPRVMSTAEFLTARSKPILATTSVTKKQLATLVNKNKSMSDAEEC